MEESESELNKQMDQIIIDDLQDQYNPLPNFNQKGVRNNQNTNNKTRLQFQRQ